MIKKIILKNISSREMFFRPPKLGAKSPTMQSMHACQYVYMHAIVMYGWIYECLCIVCIFVCMYACMFATICMYTCMNACMHMYVNMCVYMHACVCMCMHV